MYEGPALVLFLVLCALSFVSLQRSDFLSSISSNSLSAGLAVAAALVAIGAGYFALGEFLLYGVLSSLFVGLAFIAFAGSEVSFGLVPLLAGWLGHGDAFALGWGVEHVFGGALLVAAGLLVVRRVPIAHRRRRLIQSLLVIVALNVLITLWIYLAQSHPVTRTVIQTMQLGAGILFFTASFLFWRATKTTLRTWFFWLAFSIGVAGFGQVQYALRAAAIGVVQPGDILNMVFFTGILLALVAQWTQDYQRLRWQARELEALQILMTPASVQDVGSLVEHIVRIVGQSLDATARVLVEEREHGAMRDPLSEELLHMQMGRHADIHEPTRLVVGIDEGPEGQMVLGVPLRTAERQLGMLVVMRPSGEEFSSYDLRLLRAMGAQSSLLIERSLLYEEVAAGAILEERSRLAREIHDGLAQHLAFLKMRVSWLSRSAIPIERKQLKDVEGVLETALIEARHAITTLRADVQATSTREAIEGYAEEFGQVAGLQTSVEADADLAEIGPKARVELMRIVQESLNNVRKHAQATAVDVAITGEANGIAVHIRDNGVGFAIDRSMDGHFGLQIMKERAESVGGRFDVDSAPNQGTLVSIWMPGRDREQGATGQTWIRLPEAGS